MPEFKIQVFQMRANSYLIGVDTGEKMRATSILQILGSITKQEIDLSEMKSIYSSIAPHLLDELDGLAEGFSISFHKAAALFSGYDVPKTEAMGCSSLLTKDYYVRNYDFSPDLYDGVFSLVQPEQTFASAGYNLQLLGRHDGVNEHGLVAGLHFVSYDGYRKGVSPWVGIRMVLDTCSSLEEAVALLKEIPHYACYNFSIGDRNGNIAEVEASPEKVVVRYGESFLSCVNHFQDEQMKRKNRSSIEGSLERNKHLLSLNEKQLSHRQLFQHFKNNESPIFFTDYENLFGTLHTFSYSYHESRILTTIAGSKQVLDVNFQDWVNGDDIRGKNLSGNIE
ncbi:MULTISPECIES: C45 family peptidase [Rossellomorea]|uniref:C45 family autoproteolytic acyltransferase/hydolase n=1 Tax=Rossellomorea TaxID=2837508 RepID=UPI001CCD64C4|nr:MULTISPECIES: C45 family peptidase [Rossellomorea]MCA0149467.1 C45 family peptidase [Rossellomorea vietnamensis]WGG46726.1 C45 family autoproteolytic acyltransferase/hydrolase [Rossellomorea sp. DA94]